MSVRFCFTVNCNLAFMNYNVNKNNFGLMIRIKEEGNQGGKCGGFWGLEKVYRLKKNQHKGKTRWILSASRLFAST